jgi:ElaB/YqjD/DUF883 family membrane-anchored ribosome-binding protein
MGDEHHQPSNEKEKTMTSNAEHTEKLIPEVTRVVQDAQKLLQDSEGIAEKKAQALRKRLSYTLGKAKAMCQHLQQQTKETAKKTDKTIRAYPYQTIGIAVGTGLIVGLLLGRRHK